MYVLPHGALQRLVYINGCSHQVLLQVCCRHRTSLLRNLTCSVPSVSLPSFLCVFLVCASQWSALLLTTSLRILRLCWVLKYFWAEFGETTQINGCIELF